MLAIAVRIASMRNSQGTTGMRTSSRALYASRPHLHVTMPSTLASWTFAVFACNETGISGLCSGSARSPHGYLTILPA